MSQLARTFSATVAVSLGVKRCSSLLWVSMFVALPSLCFIEAWDALGTGCMS